MYVYQNIFLMFVSDWKTKTIENLGKLAFTSIHDTWKRDILWRNNKLNIMIANSMEERK